MKHVTTYVIPYHLIYAILMGEYDHLTKGEQQFLNQFLADVYEDYGTGFWHFNGEKYTASDHDLVNYGWFFAVVCAEMVYMVIE